MSLSFDKFPVILDLYGVKESREKDGKPFFPPVGIAFIGEKENKDTGELEPKISIQLNMFPDVKIYGSLRGERKKYGSNTPDF